MGPWHNKIRLSYWIYTNSFSRQFTPWNPNGYRKINSKPPRARYNIMWDPDVVLKHFVSLPENKVLSLTIISQKLATLIALACLLRVSEIAAISVSSINFSESTTTFSISRPRKTQHLGPLRSFSLPRLSGPTCPVDCLQNYVERTASVR